MFVAQSFNPSTWEREAGKYLWIPVQVGVYYQLQDIQRLHKQSLSQNNSKNN